MGGVTQDFIMASTQNNTWKRIYIETAAIVMSILLAFAIDAWWAERQVQREWRNDLVAVLEDFLYSKTSVAKRRVGYGTFRASDLRQSATDHDPKCLVPETLTMDLRGLRRALEPSGAVELSSLSTVN